MFKFATLSATAWVVLGAISYLEPNSGLNQILSSDAASNSRLSDSATSSSAQAPADAAQAPTGESAAVQASESPRAAAASDQAVETTTVGLEEPRPVEADAPRRDGTGKYVDPSATFAFDTASGPSLEEQLLEARLQVIRTLETLELARRDDDIRSLNHRKLLFGAVSAQQLARLNREVYRSGEASRERGQLRGTVALGQQRHELAARRLQWSERLAERGLIGQHQMEADRSALGNAKENLTADQERLAVFEKSAHQRQLALFDRRLDLADAEIERLRRNDEMLTAKGQLNLGMQEKSHRLALSSYERISARYEDATRQRDSLLKQERPREADVVQRRLRVEIERSLPVTTFVEQGTRVEAGDVVLELDVAELQAGIERHQSEITRLSITTEQIREQISLLRSQAEFDRSQAMLAVKTAELALAKYREDTYPKQLQNLSEQIDRKADEVDVAQRSYDWSRRVLEKGYVTPMQLKQDRLRLAERRHEFQQLELQHRVLKDHTYLRDLTNLKSVLDRAKVDAEVAKSLTDARLEKQFARLLSAEKQVAMRNQKVHELRQLIDACKVRAPVSGVVVYEGAGSTDKAIEPPRAGQHVRPYQTVMSIVVD